MPRHRGRGQRRRPDLLAQLPAGARWLPAWLPALLFADDPFLFGPRMDWLVSLAGAVDPLPLLLLAATALGLPYAAVAARDDRAGRSPAVAPTTPSGHDRLSSRIFAWLMVTATGGLWLFLAGVLVGAGSSVLAATLSDVAGQLVSLLGPTLGLLTALLASPRRQRRGWWLLAAAVPAGPILVMTALVPSMLIDLVAPPDGVDYADGPPLVAGSILLGSLLGLGMWAWLRRPLGPRRVRAPRPAGPAPAGHDINDRSPTDRAAPNGPGAAVSTRSTPSRIGPERTPRTTSHRGP
ncbi:hypothetical protein Athai_37200 [Actinocatenispora thailandica]|uniref:Uncharacterized protein n=1 Tax=Actinocatenispora thailandica TaxID=227318 RepID=A0A7R7HXI5_9ACTN|nr:hypothetical protein [Actinocatenispora thailandica]BCJ36217.1 hypothetical protein Athai_37200 [Actinocatenispora thailandica]